MTTACPLCPHIAGSFNSLAQHLEHWHPEARGLVHAVVVRQPLPIVEVDIDAMHRTRGAVRTPT